jgi:hypothetical protein
MNKEYLFECWARSTSIWSDWAKPVLFAHWSGSISPLIPAPNVPDASWAPPADGLTAIIIDLPGAFGVGMGLALALRGYQPVPLYNACPAPSGSGGVVDAQAILDALATTAPQMAQLRLAAKAPPAFMLDAHRRFGSPRPLPGSFDNRSVNFATDFPSATFLLSHGIKKAIILQDRDLPPQQDLAHTLRLWQHAGIALEGRGADNPHRGGPLIMRRPSFMGWIWFRLSMLLQLQRNPLGGFGGTLPEPSAG